ncbi:hypothetical protein J6590_063665 [Homalodisca vitripennis]|nr:hypothetical protein J6590_063665 [Homalodisca vitripennis]
MAASQQYCLRWNNHRSNLLTVFDQLLQTEAFTDVTLACEGGASVKCHKMVLAACSSYFETLFMDQQCRHPIVILKDVKYTEIKNILEYMYRGEVNVAQDQLPGMLKVAEALKVKGLGDGVNDGVKLMEDDPNTITTSSAPTSQPVPHSSSVNNSSPPHSTGIHNQGFPKVPYLYGKSPVMERVGTGGRLPMWGMPGIPLTAPPPSHTHAAAVLNSCYEAAMDMPPLRRKKLSSLLMSRGGDTPILRTVLGQGQADSSQPMSLICHPETERNHTNGSPRDIEKGNYKKMFSQFPDTFYGSFMQPDTSKVTVGATVHTTMYSNKRSEYKTADAQ